MAALEDTDAPGWKSTSDLAVEDTFAGPTCWKCRGGKVVKKKNKNNKGKPSKAGCSVCNGRGYLQSLKGMAKHTDAPGRVTWGRRPRKYVTVGPSPVGNPSQKDHLKPSKGEELCHLTGDFKIFQAVKGHRFSTDDVCTAWYAGVCCKRLSLKPERHIDLGCGIGSVLLMMSWQFETLQSTGIEAQERSFRMCQRSVEYNIGSTNPARRVTVKQGNINNISTFFPESEHSCDLVTGTPPYFATKMTRVDERKNQMRRTAEYGGMPTCLQSAPARYEFRGGIEVYCKAAAFCLKDTGRFVVCEGELNMNAKRVVEAARAHNLIIVSRLNIYGIKGRPHPLFAVYEMRRHVEEKDGGDKSGFNFGYPIDTKDMYVRSLPGKHSEDYCTVLQDMSMPTSRDQSLYRRERRHDRRISIGVMSFVACLYTALLQTK